MSFVFVMFDSVQLVQCYSAPLAHILVTVCWSSPASAAIYETSTDVSAEGEIGNHPGCSGCGVDY